MSARSLAKTGESRDASDLRYVSRVILILLNIAGINRSDCSLRVRIKEKTAFLAV
jgi:hypothetical protein